MDKLVDLYKRCLNADYIHVENDGDYAIEKDGDTMYLLFQWSHSKEDWVNNFDFPAVPYDDMETKWRCHRGFLKVWKSIKPYLKEAVADPSVKKVFCVGYSHGGPMAALCHEYVWFNRPDLRENIFGYGFGSPRFFYGLTQPDYLKKRWENFYVVRDANDIVTHVPPVFLGFSHVGNLIHVGTDDIYAVRCNKLKCVDAHRPDNYIRALEIYDQAHQ